MNEIIQHYKNAEIKFEMIKSLKCRETAIISKSRYGHAIRMLRCHNVQSLDFIRSMFLERLNDDILMYNFYYSMAKYKDGIPVQKLNNGKRDQSKWNDKHWKKIVSYDMLIDIDAGSFSEIDYAKESAVNIVGLFDFYGVPYELRFSGCGFHIIIPGKYLPKLSFNPYAERNIYQFCSKFAKVLYDKYSEMVDCSIYDSRRVCKVPYSLAVYDEGVYWCWPIVNRQQLNVFDIEGYKFDINTARYKAIKGRGLKVFNADGDLNKLLEKNEFKEVGEWTKNSMNI